MTRRQIKRTYREFTPDEARRVRERRAEAEQEKEAILAEGRRTRAAHQREVAALREAVQLLKAERQSQGLSLADVEQRSGIAKTALSGLENAQEANPVMSTLLRYAEALGKQLIIALR
jgi:hypothetical protein